MAASGEQAGPPDAVWDQIYDEAEEVPAAPRRQAAPSRAVRLFSTAFMAFIKGAVGSALVIAPFFGLWAALATTLAFTGFCLWLAMRRLPEADKAAGETVEIEQADTCHPKVRR